MRGIGLSVKLNDRNVHLLLDTGAGGIMVSRKARGKGGIDSRLCRCTTEASATKGLQSGYTAVADHIRIGELEFQDCVVAVSDKRSVADEEGLIGADVFGGYLIDIDLPGMRLKLSPLPKRPEDTVAPKSLNSEGRSKRMRSRKKTARTSRLRRIRNPPRHRFRNPTSPAQRSLHCAGDGQLDESLPLWSRILVPTSVNDSKPMLFGLDTGAFSNILSLRAGRQVGKVSSDYRVRFMD